MSEVLLKIRSKATVADAPQCSFRPEGSRKRQKQADEARMSKLTTWNKSPVKMTAGATSASMGKLSH
mgnify:CR=1 FL=1